MTDHDDLNASEKTSSDDVAPQHVQDEIAALLRSSARSSDVSEVMPSAVEDRIRAALRAEMSSQSASTPAPGKPPQTATIVPLPGRARRASQCSAAQDAAPQAPAVPAEFEHAQRFAAPEPKTQQAQPIGSGSIGSGSGASGSVVSLEDQRRKRRGKAILGLSAAAAVIMVGGTAVVSMTAKSNHDSAETTNLASRVTVTESNRSYTSDNLTTQAASLTQANSFKQVEDTPENRAKYGALVSKASVNTCIAAINSVKTADVKKVYADFGTYDSKKAVVVVVEKNSGDSDVWVVNSTCTKADDAITGPKAIDS